VKVFQTDSQTYLNVVLIRMYTLVSGFYKYMLRKDEFCVLILGLDNAGKTVSMCLFTKVWVGSMYTLVDSWLRP
jgi:hypothetical protein